MTTITVPRANVTADEIADALRRGLGVRYQVRMNEADDVDRLTVGRGSARVFRARVAVTHQGKETVIRVHPGGLTPPLQILNRLWIVAKVTTVLRGAPELK